MPEYLAPGVYVEEISTGPKPIEGVSTSTAGFIGPTERGPEFINLITSWLAFQRWYGGYLDNSFLSYAVQGFFDNGGKRCWVARVVSDTAVLARGTLGNLQVIAVGRGAWGNNVYVRVDKATKALNAPDGSRTADWFRIRLAYWRTKPEPLLDPLDPKSALDPKFKKPDVLEDYDNLTHDASAANNVVSTINGASKLIRVWYPAAPTPVQPSGSFQDVLKGGSDGADLMPSDYDGDKDRAIAPDVSTLILPRGSGLAGLEAVDDVSLLVAPDHVRYGNTLLDKLVNQCELLKYRFAILATGQQLDLATARPARDTTYGAVYYPWITVYDPLTNDDKPVPPVGHVAGVYARTDIDVGVHKAPANAVVVDATNLDRPCPKGDQDVLNPLGINCIRDFRGSGRGIRVWGARTMTSDPEWKYVNVRRLFIFVERSIDEGTQWVVFEPNSEPTWARVARTITSFLVRVWRSGALMGTTQDEAFFVKCDRTTMTQDDIDNGRLICYIGIAPVKPAEFVIFRIGQKTADAPA